MSLVLRDIQHGFSLKTVLNHITLTIHPGEVHALLGMNGAGKSTLLHIASGVYVPDQGSVEMDGQTLRLNSPLDAVKNGIAFLTQEVDKGLVGAMTVHENLTIGLLHKEQRKWFHKNQNRQRARMLFERYGISIDVDKRVNTCSLYEKQMISIVRALSNEAKYLLLDEPTASFDRQEADRFYQMVQKLKEEKIGIVFVSHRMHEVFAISDQLTVLRDGAVVLNQTIKEATLEQTVQAMTGIQTASVKRKQQSTEQPVQYDIHGLSTGEDRPPLSFHVRKGEIVVVFGLLGSGKTSIAESLFGVHQPYSATINGVTGKISTPEQAVRSRIALVPEERGRHGIWKQHNIRTHLALSFKGMIAKQKELRFSQELIQRFHIQPGVPQYLVGSLSGGNQQKVSIVKWFGHHPKIMIFDEPMKGIDVASKEMIFQAVESFASSGASILYFTSEPDEAVRIADRILVLSNRQIIKQLDPSTMSVEELFTITEKEEEDGTVTCETT